MRLSFNKKGIAMNKTKGILVTLCLFIVSLLIGCQSTDGTDAAVLSGEKPVIVCTLFPQYDFARTVYGDTAEVRMLLAPGQESHMYDPTPQDMVLISQADLFIYTGEEMEPWAAQLIQSKDAYAVLDLSAHVDLEMELEDEDHEHRPDEDVHHEGHHHEHSYDPHYWLNLENAAKMVLAVADAADRLSIDEVDMESIQERAKVYEAKLRALDEAYTELVRNSKSNCIVFAGRFAYGYLISRYGLSYETVYHSCSAEADPSIYDMARVIDYIQEHDIRVIFQEELSSGNVARTISNDTGVSVETLSTGHNVTKDEFEQGISFLDIMQQNYDVLNMALNGEMNG